MLLAKKEDGYKEHRGHKDGKSKMPKKGGFGGYPNERGKQAPKM